MRKLIHTIIFTCFIVPCFLRSKNPPPHFDSDAPAWALMLLEDAPNVRNIQAAYKAYHDERPFQKTRYTQFYKRWMQWARPYSQPNGSLLISDCGLRIADCERSTTPNRQSSIVNRQSTWSFNGPKVHYFPDASAQSVDHTNIYGFDIYAA
ncbi:MAG: hypothetical protein IPM82_22035, partial [Saprospiraceae bacterium]|nr:hypothetical protein [Saprospiraceae bacterium]